MRCKLRSPGGRIRQRAGRWGCSWLTAIQSWMQRGGSFCVPETLRRRAPSSRRSPPSRWRRPSTCSVRRCGDGRSPKTANTRSGASWRICWTSRRRTCSRRRSTCCTPAATTQTDPGIAAASCLPNTRSIAANRRNRRPTRHRPAEQQTDSGPTPSTTKQTPTDLSADHGRRRITARSPRATPHST